MFRFRCPTCNQPIELPAKVPGQKASCPSCGQRILIPGPPPHATPAPDPPTAGTLPAICPGCGRAIPLRPHELSKTIECARCDTRFVPSQPPGPPPVPRQPPPDPANLDALELVGLVKDA